MFIKNKNLVTWSVLIILTAVSYFTSERTGNSFFVIALSAITLVKVFMVVLQFMEMKKAHPAWIAILAFILLVYSGSMIYFY